MLYRSVQIWCLYKCCGSGSGIQCLFDPWIRDPEWVKIKNRIQDAGWTSRIILSRALKQFFGLKILKFCDAHPDPGSRIFLTRDPGWKNSDLGSGINIPDPQHWSLSTTCLILQAGDSLGMVRFFSFFLNVDKFCAGKACCRRCWTTSCPPARRPRRTSRRRRTPSKRRSANPQR